MQRIRRDQAREWETNMAIRDLFRPKWQHSDPHMRLRAVRQIKDPGILTNLVLNEEHLPVRMAALEKLSDQGVLGRLAAADRDSEVRKAAVRKLHDQNVLAEVANCSDDTAVGRYAVTQINDQSVLAKIAASGHDNGVRKAAVERLSNQTILAEFAVGDDAVEVRFAAVERLEEQATLAQIARTDRDGGIRAIAVGNLTDQALLTIIATDADDGGIRRAAVEKLVDQTTLARIAVTNGDADVRRVAFLKLTDQALAGIATDAEDLGIRRAAIERLDDQSVLGKIAITDPNNDLRHAALDRLAEQVALGQFNKLQQVDGAGELIAELYIHANPSIGARILEEAQTSRHLDFALTLVESVRAKKIARLSRAAWRCVSGILVSSGSADGLLRALHVAPAKWARDLVLELAKTGETDPSVKGFAAAAELREAASICDKRDLSSLGLPPNISGQLVLKNYLGRCEFSPDNSMFIGILNDGNIYVWDSCDLSLRGSLSFTNKAFPRSSALGYERYSDFAVSQDGRMLAAARRHDRVEVWSLPSLQLLSSMADLGEIWDVAVSNETLIIANTAGYMHLWDLPTKSLIKRIQTHETKPRLLVSPDGRFVCSTGSSPGSICRVQLSDSYEFRRTQVYSDAYIPHWELTSDGRFLAVQAAEDIPASMARTRGRGAPRIVDIFDVSEGTRHLGTCQPGIEWAMCNTAPIIAGVYWHRSEYEVRLWSVPGLTLIKTLTGRDWGRIDHIRFMPNGQLLVRSGKRCDIWDIESGELSATFELNDNQSGKVENFALRGDSRGIATACRGSIVESPHCLTLWALSAAPIGGFSELSWREFDQESISTIEKLIEDEKTPRGPRNCAEFIKMFNSWQQRVAQS